MRYESIGVDELQHRLSFIVYCVTRRYFKVTFLCLGLALRVTAATILLLGYQPSQAESVIKVGVYDFAPLVFVDEAGKPGGLFIDVLEHVSGQEGWKLQYVPGTWNQCLRRLERGEIDLLACIGYSRQRTNLADFTSEFLFIDWGRVFLRHDRELDSVFDLDGKKIAVLKRSIYTTGFKKLVDKFNIRCDLLVKNKYREIFKAIEDGEVDAGINGRLAGMLLESHYRVKPAEIMFSPVKIGFAAPKGNDSAILKTLDTHIAALKADKHSFYHERLRHWTSRYREKTVVASWLWTALLAVSVICVLSMGFVCFLKRQARIKTSQLSSANRALLESELRYRTILETAVDGFWVVDITGKIVAVNDAYANILGYSPEELVGMSMADLVAAEKRGSFEQHLQEVIESGSCRFNTSHLRGDGSAVLVEVSAYSAPGFPERVFAFVRDITERKEIEKRLRKNEERLRLAMEAANDGLWDWDMMTDDVYCNPRFFSMLGYEEKEFLPGIGGWDMPIHPDDRAATQEALSEYLAGTTDSFEAEFRMYHKSGEPIWILSRGKVVTVDETGKPVRMVGTHTDITDRKEAEEALRKSEREYRDLYESSAEMLFSINPYSGRIVQCNRTCTLVTGYDRGEIVGRLVSEMYHPDCAEQVKENLRLFRRTGEIRDSELRVLRKDGDILHVVLNAKAVRDEQGQVYLSRSSWRDITERKKAEEALAQSRQSFTGIVEKSADGILVLDAEGNVSYANPTALALLGREEGYLKEVPFALPIVSQECAHINIVRPDGEVRDVEMRTAPTDWLGQKALVVMLRDMTERERHEQALRQEKEKTEQYLNVAGVMFVILNNEGHVVSVNRKACQVMAREHDELIGCDWFVTAIPKESEQKMHEVFHVLMTGNFGQYEYVEAPILTKTGERRIISWHNSILRDGTGAVVGTVSSGEDITERKEMETLLLESEERYRILFERSSEAVLIERPDGGILTANPAIAELFGVKPAEFVSFNIQDFYRNPDDRIALRAEMERQGFVKDYPLEMRQIDGSEKYCLLSSSLWKDREGTVIGYLSMLRDITEARRLEEQLRQAQKMESIGTLAGGIAHDFNNILTIIQGYSEMVMASKPEDHPDYADLLAVNTAAHRGAELVKQLLTFSRKVETELRPVNLNQEVQTAVKLLSRTIPKMIDMRLFLAQNLRRISADPGQIEQIILNLSVNAKDAMPEGGTLTFETGNITLDEAYCRTHPDAAPGEHVFLSIEDTGRGMSKDVLQRVFEPFYSTKKPGEGTGLGLAMVYGIVKNHAGHITCYSEPGLGTTFTIYLPAIEETLVDRKIVTEVGPAGGSETILLVDDEEMIRTLGKKILELAGYSVMTAQDGEEAVEIYESQRSKIDLVLLDLIMPGMGGEQALAELRKIDSEGCVVLASGFAPDGLARTSKESGASGFVVKPFQRTELLRTVRAALDQQWETSPSS